MVRTRLGRFAGERGAAWRIAALLACVAGMLFPAGLVAADDGAADTAGTSSAVHQLIAEPANADYGRLRIPSLGVDAPIGVHALLPDGTMPMPYGPGDVALYDVDARTGFGGSPGAGNALLSGHVDYAARVPYLGTRYEGPGVFGDLARIRRGAAIEVQRGVSRAQYTVISVREVEADTAEWDAIFAATSAPTLTLYTCAGTFNASTLKYSRRVVVRAIAANAIRQLDATPDQQWAFGSAGTNNVGDVIAAQDRWIMSNLYSRDPRTGEWFQHVEGAPAFVNTLDRRLQADAFVVGKIERRR